MKRILGLALPLLLAAIAIACLLVVTRASLAAEDPGPTPYGLGDPVTIEFWHTYSGDREAFLQDLIEEFNTTNLDSITVQGQNAGDWNAIQGSVILGLQGDGPLPNVVLGWANQFAEYARYGGVRFLDGYLDDPVIGIPDKEDFYPVILSAYRLGQFGDQLAALQFTRSVELMYYNADLLANDQLLVPGTWEDFESACEILTSDVVSGTVVDMDASRFITWLWSRGGELLSEDLSYSRFQEQEGIDTLQLFEDLFVGGYAREPGDLYGDQAAFCEGEVGFTFGTSTSIPYYRAAMEDGAGHEWGVTRVPALPGNEVIDSYGAAVGVLGHSEDEDRAAWLFIRWLTDLDQTARWAAMSGYFPVRISAGEHPSMTQKLSEDPQYAQAYALLPLARHEPAVLHYDVVRAIVHRAVNEVLIFGEEIIDTLQTAAAEVDAVLDESGPTTEAISPDGGTLVFTNTEGLTATIEFPEGAVEVTQTVSYVPLTDLPTDGLAFALIPDLAFNEPVTITIEYLDSDVVGMDENELKLYTYDWASWSWVDADPCGGYTRDPLNNILAAGVCHFSDYAVIDWPYTVYLPLVLRNW